MKLAAKYQSPDPATHLQRSRSELSGIYICLCVILLVISCVYSSSAYSAQLQKTQLRLGERKQDNFVLYADEVSHDDRTQSEYARGNVQIVSEPYILLADEIQYSQKQDLMIARGNVRLMQQQPDGKPSEVLFADYLEMTSDINNGSIINARMLFSDNSRMVARNAIRKLDDNPTPNTELEDVIYSPCELCKEDPTRAPIWQLKADKVVHDSADKRIRYKNATMEFYGVPFFYTPYFSHPDPSVKQEAGFLPPAYLTSDYLGQFLRTYYYYPISPTQDATIEMSYASNQNPLLGVEWRKQFNKGSILTRMAGTYGELETLTGTSDKFRGYFQTNALLDINRRWRAGADIFYAGDPTFLRQYKYSNEDILKNRIYAERFRGRSYGSISAYAFQDFRPSRPGDQPNLLPYLTYSTYGRPGATLGGRWGLESSFLSVSRPYGGQSMQRGSANMNWERQWFSSTGIVNKLSASMRGDIYQIQNADATYVGTARAGKDYGVSRFFPSIEWQTSMPFVKTGDYLQYELEPLVSVSATPRLKNAAIPNEDSLDVELDPTNLLNLSRFPGLDRVEDGQRLTYGMRSRIVNRDGGYAYAFLGQSFRLNGNRAFPVGSGLDRDASDLVAQVNAVPSKYLDIDYRTRLDDTTLAPQRHELNFNAGPTWLRWGTTYAFLKQVQNTGILQSRQQIINSATATIDDHWRLTVGDTKDLDDGAKSLITTASLQYIDECFSIMVSGQRDYTQRIGISSGDSFYVTFSFKNLGEFTTPTFNTLSPGASTSTQ